MRLCNYIECKEFIVGDNNICAYIVLYLSYQLIPSRIDVNWVFKLFIITT